MKRRVAMLAVLAVAGVWALMAWDVPNPEVQAPHAPCIAGSWPAWTVIDLRTSAESIGRLRTEPRAWVPVEAWVDGGPTIREIGRAHV